MLLTVVLIVSCDAAGNDPLRLARLWLDIRRQIGALLGIPEPPHVARGRATLQPRVQARIHARPDS